MIITTSRRRTRDCGTGTGTGHQDSIRHDADIGQELFTVGPQRHGLVLSDAHVGRFGSAVTPKEVGFATAAVLAESVPDGTP